MAIYLTGTGNLSPQPTWGVEALESIVSYAGSRLTAREPDYSNWIDPKFRRMSRIAQMGAAGGLLALRNAGIEKPDAIITGTGFGCLQDTGNFLTRMVNNQEEALNPTPFIQSTHNTIGGQLALILNCNKYNVTYTNGPFSFEDALLDGMMLAEEDNDKKILVGGVDEITDASHHIHSRFGILKKNSSSNLDLFKSETQGTIMGEGSAWFVLNGRPGNSDSKIEGVQTFIAPDFIPEQIREFLVQHESQADGIDLVLAGKSGNQESDQVIDQLLDSLFPNSSIAVYKHLCGEYPTASAFALWMAATILKTGHTDSSVLQKDKKRIPQRILIYNQYFRDHHSLILLSKA